MESDRCNTSAGLETEEPYAVVRPYSTSDVASMLVNQLMSALVAVTLVAVTS